MANENPETPEERAALAAVIRRLVATRFNGEKKAAYTEARLNSTTWDRLASGETVRGYIVTRVVNNLWPEAEGDWRRVPGVDLVDDLSVEELEAKIQSLQDELARRQGYVSTDDGEARPTAAES